VPLDGERGAMVYMPPGIAHGFYACDDSLLLYHVTSQHAPAQDAGIRWNSAGIPWPDDRPELSERDRAFPSLAEFTSPFRFHPEGSPL
jgi:dTDP-4-dehydrorhamnose 3,5-epimerase